eukprot:gene32090-biopygen77798
MAQLLLREAQRPWELLRMRDSFGNTPLHIAVLFRRREMAAWLMARLETEAEDSLARLTMLRGMGARGHSRSPPGGLSGDGHRSLRANVTFRQAPALRHRGDHSAEIWRRLGGESAFKYLRIMEMVAAVRSFRRDRDEVPNSVGGDSDHAAIVRDLIV